MSSIHLAIGMNRAIPLSDCGNRLKSEEAALAAARARLAASLLQYQRSKGPRSEIYYPVKRIDEESIHEIHCSELLDAIVTRNHYGSLVLNAHHALFIDVDMPRPSNSSARGVPCDWQSAFDDLSTVLASERRTGFRIYRTAAGFRILATTHEFEPGSECSNDLMGSVGADSQFVRLCGTQKTFRARLTPKPWRCGATNPPNQFPRKSADEERCFSDWLAQYKHVCRNRATCQFLKHVGPQQSHKRITPIIDLHDRATKSHERLELA